MPNAPQTSQTILSSQISRSTKGGRPRNNTPNPINTILSTAIRCPRHQRIRSQPLVHTTEHIAPSYVRVTEVPVPC